MASFLGNNLNDGRATIETNGGHDSGCSFVTLLTNDSFFPGVTALCKSLRATSSGDKSLRKHFLNLIISDRGLSLPT